MSFNSGHSTTGAGKSGVGKRRFGVDSPWFFPTLTVVLVPLSPLTAGMFAATTVAARVRRVRTSRMVAAAAVVTVVCLIVVGGNPGRAVSWHLQGTLSVLTPTGLIDLLQGGINFIANQAGITPWRFPTPEYGFFPGLLRTAPAALPAGAWLAAFAVFWMTWRRSALADVEGPRFDWSRPEGFVDRARGKRNRRRIATGAGINVKKREVAVGVGAYGYPVRLRIDSMQQPMIVLGSPRQGKTRMAINTVTQAIALQSQVGHPTNTTNPPSGWLLIDFKGDGELPAHAAAFAAARGRRFRHFTLADKSGAPYHPPHPEAPAQPAFYDPLRRGNATSKTDMLVNSVGRDGDAAAYFRAAYELTQVVYQVASLAGYDRDKGGFQVLEDLLDVDNLQKVADTTGPDGRGVLADHPGLLSRVEKMVATFKRDEILRGAAFDLARLLSTYGNGPAAGPWLRPGPDSEADIDLYRAVYDGDIVVFSLSVQDYGELAKNIGTLVLLDLQNVISQLRADLGAHRRAVGDPNALPTWAPFYFQVEEFGSAGADAVLDVLNKAGDVQVRPILSTQSWHDIVAVDDTGTFGRRVLDQASNVVSFGINDGDAGKVLSDLTEEVTKQYPRDSKEFSGGIFGLGLRAANVGAMQTNPVWERQVPPSGFQALPRFHCIWIDKDTNRTTHTHPARANHWWEVIGTEPVAPDILPTAAGNNTHTPAPEATPPAGAGEPEATQEPDPPTPTTGTVTPTPAPVAVGEVAEEAPLPVPDDDDEWETTMTPDPATSTPQPPDQAAQPPTRDPDWQGPPPRGVFVGTRPALGYVPTRATPPEPDPTGVQDGSHDPDRRNGTPRDTEPHQPAADPTPPQAAAPDILDGFGEF